MTAQATVADKYSHALLVTGSRTWDDEAAIRRTFNDAWVAWGPRTVERPLLISGHARDGADAMAEMLFRAQGFDVLKVRANWSSQGRKAGFVRNQEMVDRAAGMCASGTEVLVVAFLDPCAKPGCRREPAGHPSHGTADCRGRALAAGLPVVDVRRCEPTDPAD